MPSPPQPDSDSVSGLGHCAKPQVTSLIGHCHLEPDSRTPMAQKESACSKKSSCTRVMCWRRRRDSNSCLNGYKSPKCAALCWTTQHVGCASMLACCLQRVPEQARRRMARKPKGQTDRWSTSDGGSFASWAGWTKKGAAVGRQPLLLLERTAHADPRRVDPHAPRAEPHPLLTGTHPRPADARRGARA
jgi:hypothetical protein